MDDEVEIILQQDSVDVTEPLVADYVLPKASNTTLGGVKIGDNINISGDGHISVPMASSNTLGLIKIGSGLTIDANGVVTASGEYELPQATKTTLGGVYVDDELDDESVNPVQNATVTTAIDGVSSELTTLSGTVDDLSDDIDALSSTVTTMSGTLGLIKIGTGLSIDENGVVTASGEYDLPQATKTTLGGVYLDDELDDESVNPVQNATLTTVISGIDSNVSDLTDSVDDLTDTVSDVSTAVTGLTTTVGTLNSTVSGLSTTVSGQTSAIATNTSDIGTINNTLTNHGNDLATLAGQVSDLYQDISETYTYEDIDDTIWTAGDIEIRGKGFYAVMYIQLEGALSIPTGSSVTLYTLPNDAIPAYDAFGGADIVDGSISIKVDSTNGNINLINNNTTSVNVGKLNASIPIIYGSI